MCSDGEQLSTYKLGYQDGEQKCKDKTIKLLKKCHDVSTKAGATIFLSQFCKDCINRLINMIEENI